MRVLVALVAMGLVACGGEYTDQDERMLDPYE
jgi:hypothetical protein